MAFQMRAQGAIELLSGATAGTLKGQGATEYLVLLAVVLVIALVSIALLGFFPGLSTDAKMAQSNLYWGEASPFAIRESGAVGSTTAINLVLQNMDASGTFTITTITMAPLSGGWSVAYSPNTAVGPGEIKRFTINTGIVAPAGTIYEFSTQITYTTPNGLTKVQYGAKPLMGKYT